MNKVIHNFYLMDEIVYNLTSILSEIGEEIEEEKRIFTKRKARGRWWGRRWRAGSEAG